MADVVMPRLSDSMEEGTVLAWMKAVGDEVAVGDELVEIETDKANMVYESDTAGTLTEIVAEEGATLPIGEVIARIGDAGDAPVGGEADGDVEDAPEKDSAAADSADTPEPTERTEQVPIAPSDVRSAGWSELSGRGRRPRPVAGPRHPGRRRR